MLKPEAMQRTLIVSSKGQQAAVIEALHDLRAAHFVDFTTGRGGEFADFRIGSPLPEGAKASALLVRIRALLRQLGLEGLEPTRALTVAEIESRLEAHLDLVERQVSAAIEARESSRQALQEGREHEAKLEPLRTIPLRLEDYRGYDTLTVFVGRADEKRLHEELRPLAAREHLLVPGEGVFALFVPRAHAGEFQDALFRAGFQELEVPEGKGTPDERVREIQSSRGALEARVRQADQEVERLAQEHRDFLLAADEHLGILVEKAEAPLSFASTENAFVIDAWIPATDVATVERALEQATGGNVHFQLLETASAHGHGHHHGGHVDAAYDADLEEPHHEEPAAPPTKYANARGVRRFEWFTNLFSTPRYDEIDPTPIFAIFFPLFFGFMIGDLGLGLLMVGLGWLLIAKLPKVDGMKQLGTAFVVAGVVAAVFGGLVFKDAIGIPLGVNHHLEDYLVEAGYADPTCSDLYAVAHEPTWSCLFRGGDAAVHYEAWSEPLVYKVTDVTTMLLISVGAALVHLLIGLVIGLRNELGHGAKHVAAKAGYLVLLLTFFPAVVALLAADGWTAATGTAATTAYLIAGVGFVLGAVILGWAEGFAGVLEIPSMFSAIMSYLRLGAVAIAKGAMAVAFNALTLVPALLADNVIGVLLGLIGFVVAQSVLFVLGMLSGGIQALRLNFVEFFTKFYKGGGVPFKPFGRARRVTLLDGRPSGGGARPVEATPVLSTP